MVSPTFPAGRCADANPNRRTQRENVYTTFKFTPKTTRISLIWAVAVPAILYIAVKDQNVKPRTQTHIRSNNLLLSAL